MKPLLFVEEEFANVRRALDESLRFEYGPGQTAEYYEECRFRLKEIHADIKRLKTGGGASPASVMGKLKDLASRLTLIERSHLGEFSWPFADVIKGIALKLLQEDESLKKRHDPIIHMVAEGTSYQILGEEILDSTKRQRMFTVAFPRQLKHHVLMHTLFGHELGHATFYLTRATDGSAHDGKSASDGITEALQRDGPLRDPDAATKWLVDAAAPPSVRSKALAASSRMTPENLAHWYVELLCDLFGLVIFGPAFSAAHRAYLEPSVKQPPEVETRKISHPPYVLRRTLLAQAMRLLGWNAPVLPDDAGPYRAAEDAFLAYVSDGGTGWSQVFSDEQIRAALGEIVSRFDATKASRARRPSLRCLGILLERMCRRLPPVGEEIDRDGTIRIFEVRPEEQLYAGWTYWLGREHLAELNAPNFFEVNQLCELAMLQQLAIEIVSGRAKR